MKSNTDNNNHCGSPNRQYYDFRLETECPILRHRSLLESSSATVKAMPGLKNPQQLHT
jgi:hypothetical protein